MNKRRSKRVASGFQKFSFSCLLFFGGSLWSFSSVAAPATSPDVPAALNEIVVTAGWRAEESLREVPASVAVLDAAALEAGAVQHFEELAVTIPNLGFSGESGRARHFQVRGSGELEQYEGAPNPSVGFIIDDIDFSGIGGIATRFDTARVEVLRGPQATRHGANALAGMIYMRSTAPTMTPDARVEVGAGSDGMRSIGAAGGGPVAALDDRLAWRVAVQRFESDGFRRNIALGRRDTSDRDELTARGRLRWLPAPGWQVDATVLYVDLDNGYDDWSLDNSFTTWSDQPGRDAQKSRAVSLRIERVPEGRMGLVAISSIAASDIDFAFDADWGNPALWAPDIYAYSQDTTRFRRSFAQELRLLSGPEGRLAGRLDWVLGARAERLGEDNRIADRGLLDLDDAACPPGDPDGFCAPWPTERSIKSDYSATSVALFGELKWPLAEATHLALGLRGERRHARYSDEVRDRFMPDPRANRFAPTDHLWGGELTLRHSLGPALEAYGRIARGYKAGGFNPSLARVDFSQPDLNLSSEQVTFASESLWNHELGLHYAGPHLAVDLSLFWQQRERMQVRVPMQLAAGDPNTFVFVTDNAKDARVRGAEASLTWRPVAAWRLQAGLGWLDTRLQRFPAAPEHAGSVFPHAPSLSWSAGVDWSGSAGWFAEAAAHGRSRYRFDYDTSMGSERWAASAALARLRAGWRGAHWEFALWVHNLFDEEHATRGFYFGNEPPAFEEKRYLRRGDPRHMGININWKM